MKDSYTQQQIDDLKVTLRNVVREARFGKVIDLFEKNLRQDGFSLFKAGMALIGQTLLLIIQNPIDIYKLYSAFQAGLFSNKDVLAELMLDKEINEALKGQAESIGKVANFFTDIDNGFVVDLLTGLGSEKSKEIVSEIVTEVSKEQPDYLRAAQQGCELLGSKEMTAARSKLADGFAGAKLQLQAESAVKAQIIQPKDGETLTQAQEANNHLMNAAIYALPIMPDIVQNIGDMAPLIGALREGGAFGPSIDKIVLGEEGMAPAIREVLAHQEFIQKISPYAVYQAVINLRDGAIGPILADAFLPKEQHEAFRSGDEKATKAMIAALEPVLGEAVGVFLGSLEAHKEGLATIIKNADDYLAVQAEKTAQWTTTLLQKAKANPEFKMSLFSELQVGLGPEGMATLSSHIANNKMKEAVKMLVPQMQHVTAAVDKFNAVEQGDEMIAPMPAFTVATVKPVIQSLMQYLRDNPELRAILSDHPDAQKIIAAALSQSMPKALVEGSLMPLVSMLLKSSATQGLTDNIDKFLENHTETIDKMAEAYKNGNALNMLYLAPQALSALGSGVVAVGSAMMAGISEATGISSGSIQDGKKIYGHFTKKVVAVEELKSEELTAAQCEELNVTAHTVAVKIAETLFGVGHSREYDQKLIEQSINGAFANIIAHDPSKAVILMSLETKDIDKMVGQHRSGMLATKQGDGLAQIYYNEATQYTSAGILTGGIQVAPQKIQSQEVKDHVQQKIVGHVNLELGGRQHYAANSI